MAFFTTDDGVKLYYEAFGGGEKTIVFVHGIMDSHLSFQGHAAPLVEHCRVVVYDQRAHGRSDAPREGYTMARLAQDLKNLIDCLQLQHVILVGYSMGVHVVLDYVEQFGADGIDKFVLSVMSPRLLTDDTYKLGINGDFTQEAADKAVENLRKYYTLMRLLPVNSYKGDPRYKKQVAPYYKRSRKMKKEPLIALQIALTAGDYWPTLDKLTKPTLVIAGENDIYPTETHKATHARLADSKLVIIPNAGHMVLLERPDIYIGALKNFILHSDA